MTCGMKVDSIRTNMEFGCLIKKVEDDQALDKGDFLDQSI